MTDTPESLSAKASLIGLTSRAIDLRRQLGAQEAQARNPIGGSLVDLGIGALVPYGLKGTARRFAVQAASNARRQRSVVAHEAVSRLVTEARSFAAQHALIPAQPSIRLQPGSATKWLGAGLDSGSPESKLLKLEQSLRRLTEARLIENSRIAAYRQQIEYEKAKARVRTLEPPLANLLGTFTAPLGASTLRVRLQPFLGIPSVQGPLEGALRSLGRENPEDYRQGLNSLRVALDALIEAVTGKGDWKEGVVSLVSVDEERKVVSAAHHYLSRASHHGSRFDRASLALGFDLFASIGSRLVELARRVGSKV
jgi:hypothetical protein